MSKFYRAAKPLIVHIVFRLGVGGLENGLVNLINHRLSIKYRHAIICITESGCFSSRLKNPDVEIVEIHKQPGKDFGSYYRMWKAIRRLSPDLIHTRNANAIEYQLAALLAGVQHRIHGEHGWDTHDLYGRSIKYRWLRRILSPLVNVFITVSRQLSEYLAELVGVPERKIRQIYNGVNTARFVPATGDESNRRDGKMQAESDRVVLGIVGRLHEVKNHAFAIRTLSEMRDVDPGLFSEVRLIIAGDGPLALQLQGHRDDIAEFMRTIDVFLLPSKNEGISNTLLEAMACGIPSIATKVGGTPEVLVDGETGFLVTPGNCEDLISKIRIYADEPELRRRHGDSARSRILKHFGLDIMVSGYVEVYDKLMGNA
jgi:sugar transferase (PEP-CTERM/EpsH1 system associated)